MERGVPFGLSNNVAVYTTDLTRKICDKISILTDSHSKAMEAKEKVLTPLPLKISTRRSTVMYKQWHLLPQEFAVFILFHDNHYTLSILCYANQFFCASTEAATAPCVLLHLDPQLKKRNPQRKHTLLSCRTFRNLTLTLTPLTDVSHRNTLTQRQLRR